MGKEAAAPFFIAAADAINRLDCGDIALDSYVSPAKAGHDPLSYYVHPLLAMIRDDGFNRGVWYTDVNNLTERYDAAENHPSLVQWFAWTAQMPLQNGPNTIDLAGGHPCLTTSSFLAQALARRRDGEAQKPNASPEAVDKARSSK